jgi:hypothetical protein
MRDAGKEVKPPQEGQGGQGDRSNVYRHYSDYADNDTGKPGETSSEVSTSKTPFSWEELKRGNHTPEAYAESYMAGLPDVFHPLTEEALKAALTANFTVRQEVDSFNRRKILAVHAAPDDKRTEMTQVWEMSSENEKRELQERHKSSLELLKGYAERYEALADNVIRMVNRDIEQAFGKDININDLIKTLERDKRKKEEKGEKINSVERNNLEYFQGKLKAINRNKELTDSLNALQNELAIQW